MVCRISNQSKFAAIEEMLQKCTVFSSLPSLTLFKEQVFQREKLESTGIGQSIAIAHGKVTALAQSVVALGISLEGIEFEAQDGRPVHFLFVIASSPSRRLEYIKTISNILRTMREEIVQHELLLWHKNLLGLNELSPLTKLFLQTLCQQSFANLAVGVMPQ